MLLARSHDLMHFAASSGCSWQRLQPCVPHASRQHWHASLHAHWCCGYVRAGVARIAAAWLLVLVAGVADAVLIPSSHSHLDLSKDTLAAALCCCHWCVLHCAQWLCRCVGSYPCCCCAVLCVRVVCWREGRGRERAIQTQSKAKEGRKRASKRERRLSQNGKREDAHTKEDLPFLPLLLRSSSNQTQQTHNKKKERDAHRLVVDKKEGEQSHGKMDGWDAHCLVSHTNTHCIFHWKGEHE